MINVTLGKLWHCFLRNSVHIDAYFSFILHSCHYHWRCGNGQEKHQELKKGRMRRDTKWIVLMKWIRCNNISILRTVRLECNTFLLDLFKLTKHALMDLLQCKKSLSVSVALTYSYKFIWFLIISFIFLNVNNMI